MPAVTLDSVRAMKMEAPSEGGTQFDICPTELNPLQDALTAAGVYVQDTTGTAADKTVLMDRSGKNLRLTDQITSHVLGELVSSSAGQVGSHNALPDLMHFLGDGGPGDGWASGTYRVDSYAGPLMSNSTWYTSSAKTTKIYSVAYSYGGPLVSQAVRTVYDASGNQARQATDTYFYVGPICVQVARTWT